VTFGAPAPSECVDAPGSLLPAKETNRVIDTAIEGRHE
jgi:hypothetical protein